MDTTTTLNEYTGAQIVVEIDLTCDTEILPITVSLNALKEPNKKGSQKNSTKRRRLGHKRWTNNKSNKRKLANTSKMHLDTSKDGDRDQNKNSLRSASELSSTEDTTTASAEVDLDGVEVLEGQIAEKIDLMADIQELPTALSMSSPKDLSRNANDKRTRFGNTKRPKNKDSNEEIIVVSSKDGGPDQNKDSLWSSSATTAEDLDDVEVLEGQITEKIDLMANTQVLPNTLSMSSPKDPSRNTNNEITLLGNTSRPENRDSSGEIVVVFSKDGDTNKSKETLANISVLSATENTNAVPTEKVLNEAEDLDEIKILDDTNVLYLFSVNPTDQIVEEIDLAADTQVHPKLLSSSVPKQPSEGAKNTNNKRKLLDSSRNKIPIKRSRINPLLPRCSSCKKFHSELDEDKNEYLCIGKCGHLICSVCAGIKNSELPERNCTLCKNKLQDLRKIYRQHLYLDVESDSSH